MNNQNQLPSEIFVSCASPIDDQLVQKMFNTFSIAINNRVKIVNLLIHSPGGYVPSGIAIYNFLSNIPITNKIESNATSQLILSFRLVRNLSLFSEGFPTRFACGNDNL